LRALHPDTSTPELRVEAFRLVVKKKLLLRDDGPIVLAGVPMSRTVEELLAKRAAKEAMRKAERWPHQSTEVGTI
jgi:hypothetical protein